MARVPLPLVPAAAEFNECILIGLARLDEPQFDAMTLSPLREAL